MESSGGSSATFITANAAVSAAMPSPSNVADTSKVFCSSLFKATQYEFDPSVTEEERRFYLKAYPTVDVVRDRKTHCTVCKVHIGTAPVQENGIKMHPILRVTHCNKCHDFYNSGEFSKGEDGSELYCRWCGQGGEVYCCSSCPYVFCKSCIVKNLSRGVVADIEQNENWNCFSCAPKILWPLRAQHWALMNYIEQQKKEIYAMNLSEAEIKQYLSKDRSKCCRLAKAKCGNMSDSMESLDSIASKRSHTSSNSAKKPIKHPATASPQQINPAKRAKNNDEVVCTPDLLSMLEPDCQITVSSKTNRSLNVPSASTPKIMSIQQPPGGYGAISSAPKSSVPPPLVLRNTAVKLRPVAPPPVVRRTIIGPRTPNPGGNGTPVYHTINGYRIDLNSAAQQETFRLPNGKLIQVKRQGPPPNVSPSPNNWQQMTSPQPQRVVPQTIASRAVQITQHPYNISVQQTQSPQVVRYHSNIIGSTSINPVNHNGAQIQVLNGQIPGTPQPHSAQQTATSGPIRPVMVRHVFPDNPVGQARSGLQDQVFNAMEICTHLTNKVQTLTNSNAYKQARNFLEVKELYIHLSYLLTYAIGRFKSLQDKCLGDMRTLGFGNDADCLENGQLAADKQASDDEDNEIEIVEPKTDLITLDSDDEEPTASSTPSRTKTIAQAPIKSIQSYPNSPNSDVKVKPVIPPASIASNRTDVSQPVLTPTSAPTTDQIEENIDLMSMAQSFLASMLEVDIQEVNLNSPGGSDSSGQKKQPRKKLTSKPNPTLLKQKALMERERLEELKRNDLKLKMKCSVELQKAEDEYPFAKSMLEARVKEKQELEKDTNEKQNEEMEKEKLLKLLVETDKDTVEVELFLEEENVNGPSEVNKTLENESAASNDLNEIKESESNDPNREVKKGQSAEASVIGDNENRDDEDLERNVSIAEVKSGDRTELIEDGNDLKNKELNKENKETESETATKTAEIIEEENENVEDKTQNGIDKLNVAELLDDTDENKIQNCDRTPLEDEIKESLENIDKSTETANIKVDVSVNKEIENILQPPNDNANDNDKAKPNDKFETSNNIPDEVIIKEITSDLTSKEPMTSSIDTRVQMAETSSITTTSNGSV